MAAHQTITTSKKVAVTFTLPSLNTALLLKKVKKQYSQLLSSIFGNTNSFSNSDGVPSRARRVRMPRMGKMNFNFNKKYFKILFPVIIVLVVIIGIVSLV